MESIRNIGDLRYNHINSEDKLLEIFTEDINSNGRYDKVLEIRLKDIGDKLVFDKINKREYDNNLKFKYLYRSGSSNGTDITPTAKITTPQKTYQKKIVPSIKEAIDYIKITKNISENKLFNEEELLKSVYSLLKDNDLILEEINKKFNETPTKERYYILTIVIEKNYDEIYVGDFEVFKNRIREIPIQKFYYSKTNNKTSRAEDKYCSLCHNKKEVFGLASPFAFYTIDKPGYICGGFDYESSWKNYPVCKECAIKLELGKLYLDEELLLSFYGRRFYLIPKLIYNNQLEEILNKYKNTFKQEDDKSSSKMIKGEDRLENKIFKILGKEKNNITFDLMFIEENNSALNILLNIEDVYPSTFKKLYSTWEDIKNMEFFNEYHYLANFGYLNMLFNSKTYNRYFLDTVDKIIGKGKIEYDFLISFINTKLKEAFVKEEKNEQFVKGEDNYYVATLRAYTFIYYLYKIEKFKNKGEEGVDNMERKCWNIEDFNSKREVFEDFFDSNKAFFDTDSKKAVFMVGYLSKRLINIQARNEDGRKPFMSQLNGLNLNKKDICRLIPKIQNKFMEYKKEFYDEELSIASEYLIDSQQLKDLSNLDIPLYFSLGMNMVRKFNLNKKEEEDKNEK